MNAGEIAPIRLIYQVCVTTHEFMRAFTGDNAAHFGSDFGDRIYAYITQINETQLEINMHTTFNN